jgi:hypothetical protein
MIDRQTVRSVREDLDHALREIGERHGLNLRTGSATFTAVKFTMKIEASVVDTDGVDLAAQREFKVNAFRYGLPDDAFGKEFTGWDGIRYRVVGLKPRRRKFPISAVRVSDGRAFKFPVSTVSSILEG